MSLRSETNYTERKILCHILRNMQEIKTSIDFDTLQNTEVPNIRSKQRINSMEATCKRKIYPFTTGSTVYLSRSNMMIHSNFLHLLEISQQVEIATLTRIIEWYPVCREWAGIVQVYILEAVLLLHTLCFMSVGSFVYLLVGPFGIRTTRWVRFLGDDLM